MCYLCYYHYHFYYCTFHKHANSKAQKLPSQLCFSMPSIIITITRNEPWNTETHKMDWNPPITNHKPLPFELVKVKFCFLRGPLRWLMAVKNAIISWLLNFRLKCLQLPYGKLPVAAGRIITTKCTVYMCKKRIAFSIWIFKGHVQL